MAALFVDNPLLALMEALLSQIPPLNCVQLPFLSLTPGPHPSSSTKTTPASLLIEYVCSLVPGEASND
jgi:hypothetical protein